MRDGVGSEEVTGAAHGVDISALPKEPERKRKAKRKGPSPLDPVVYAGVRGLLAATQIAGETESTRFMRSLGGVFGNLPFNRKRLDRAVANIAWCFPWWSEEERVACAVESYRHLFSLIPEVGAGPRVITPDGYSKHVVLGDMSGVLRELIADRPVLLLTGHCGNWELLGSTLAVLGVPMHALYRPLDMKALDDWAHRTRSAQGLELVDKFGAAVRLPQLLQQNEAVGFIADQNAGNRGLFVPFFNRLASAYKTIAVLAMRFDAAIVCGQAFRTAGHADEHRGSGLPASELPERASFRAVDRYAFQYRIEIQDIIRPEDWADRDDKTFYITARYRYAIEQMVRRAPEQYLWMHRYWKSRPRHERMGKPFPDRLREKLRSLEWLSEADVALIEERSAIDGADFVARKGKKTR